MNKSIFGEDDNATISSVNNLAYCYTQDRKLEEAIKLLEERLERNKSNFGDHHLTTLTSMNNLAVCYKDAKKLDRAIEIWKKALEKSKLLRGEDHDDTIQIMIDLAACFQEQKMLKEAFKVLEEAHTICKAYFDENDPPSKKISESLDFLLVNLEYYTLSINQSY